MVNARWVSKGPGLGKAGRRFIGHLLLKGETQAQQSQRDTAGAQRGCPPGSDCRMEVGGGGWGQLAGVEGAASLT